MGHAEEDWGVERGGCRMRYTAAGHWRQAGHHARVEAARRPLEFPVGVQAPDPATVPEFVQRSVEDERPGSAECPPELLRNDARGSRSGCSVALVLAQSAAVIG